MPSSRYFFAVWPPAAAAAALEAWARALEGRVTPASQIHLTLAFLGAAQPEKALAAARRVKAIPHSLPLEQARYWKHNKIVWVGPQSVPPALADLVSQLHRALREASFVLEERPFAAHVTLLRKARPVAALPPPPRVAWPVDEFVLVRSRTSPKGSTYEPVERYSLS